MKTGGKPIFARFRVAGFMTMPVGDSPLIEFSRLREPVGSLCFEGVPRLREFTNR